MIYFDSHTLLTQAVSLAIKYAEHKRDGIPDPNGSDEQFIQCMRGALDNAEREFAQEQEEQEEQEEDDY